MSEPLPVYVVPDPCEPDPWTPTYDDLIHYADIGRRLTVEAGYPLDARPPAAIVLRALRAQGRIVPDWREQW